MINVLSIIGIFAFGSLAYAFWYAGRDQLRSSAAKAMAGNNLVSGHQRWSLIDGHRSYDWPVEPRRSETGAVHHRSGQKIDGGSPKRRDQTAIAIPSRCGLEPPDQPSPSTLTPCGAPMAKDW